MRDGARRVPVHMKWETVFLILQLELRSIQKSFGVVRLYS